MGNAENSISGLHTTSGASTEPTRDIAQGGIARGKGGLGRRTEIVTDLGRAVGSTPLYRTRHLSARADVEIYLKLEYFNPGGSIKDRTALYMIEGAEQAGSLRPGMTIIESSSGNTAIGLSMLASERDYGVVAICDRHLPATKRARLAAYGARIVFLPYTPPGMDTVELRIALANRLAANVPDAITLGQYTNPANVDAHYHGTGPEILAALGAIPSVVVASVGTCGTISGVGRALKEFDQGVRIVGVEPVGSVIFGGSDATYYVQGGGLSFVPPILDRSVIDFGLKVSDADAIAAAHEFARREGIMVGGTGGLVLHALRSLSAEMSNGQCLVGIIPDAGDRYMDTLYNDAWLLGHGFAPLNPQGEHTTAPCDSSSGERKRHAGGSGMASDLSSPLTGEVDALGCSIDHIPPLNGPSLPTLCERIGIALPKVVAATLDMQ